VKIFNFLLAKSESVNTCTHLSQALFCGRIRESIRGLSEISVFFYICFNEQTGAKTRRNVSPREIHHNAKV
jgi:hypothetical protein